MPIRHHITRIGFIGIGSIPFLIPMHTLPIPSFYLEWWAIVCGLLALVSLASIHGETGLTVPRSSWLLLALGGLILGQMATGKLAYPSQGGLALLYLLWATLLMLATRVLVEVHGKDTILNTLAWSLLVAGVVNAVIGTFQGFDIHTPLTDHLFSYGSIKNIAFGHIGQRNLFADFLAIALAATLYLGYRRNTSPAALLVFGLILLWGLTLSTSRTAWLYLIAMLALALVLRRKQPDAHSRQLVWNLVLGLAIFSLMQIALSHFGYSSATTRIAEGVSPVDSTRLIFWKHALAMFSAEPWLGVGYQHFAWQHFELTRADPALFSAKLETVFTQHAHNLPLQLMAEFGIAGLLLSVAGAWWLLRLIWRVASPEQWWLVAGLTVITIHSLLEYPLWHANFLGVFAILAALADDRHWTVDIPAQSIRRLSLFMILLGFGLLALFYPTYKALERTPDIFKAKDSSALRTEQFRQDFNTAQLNPFFEPLVNTLLSDMPPVGMNNPETAAFRLALNEKVMRDRPYAEVIYQRATLLWLAGRRQDAEQWLIEAIRVYPYALQKYLERIESIQAEIPDLAPLVEAAKKHASSSSPAPAMPASGRG